MFDKKGKSILRHMKEGQHQELQDMHNTEETCLKRRYIATFMLFLVLFLLNSFRINMSISLVSMVNFTENFTIPIVLDTSNSSYITEGSTLKESKFNWDSVAQGYILGSGFLGYFLTIPVGGKATEIFGAKVILVGGTLVSSICNVMTPFCADCHIYFLIGVQLVRGLAQGLLVAPVWVFMANWFPQPERGHLSSFVMSGFSMGILIGGFLTGLLCDSTAIGGWRFVFYSFGTAGVATSVFLMSFLHELPAEDSRISKSELTYILNNQENKLASKRPNVPWRKFASSLPVYALSCGLTGQQWTWSHYMTVHPKFLDSVLHYSVRQNGVFTSVPFAIQIITVYAASYLSFWLQKKKYLDVNKLRKLWNLIACTGYSCCLAAIIISNYDRKTTLLSSMICAPFFGLTALGTMIVATDMSPTFAGTLQAIGSTIGATTGFIIPVITGFLLKDEDSTGQWTKFFMICITVVMSCCIIFTIFGSANVQEWNFSETPKNTRKEDEKEEINTHSDIQKLSNCVNHI